MGIIDLLHHSSSLCDFHVFDLVLSMLSNRGLALARIILYCITWQNCARRRSMKEYRIIFSDIDGTLLDSRHRVSGATRAKIQELDRRGVPFVLVSARMPDTIFPIQEALGIRAPIVCYGGGLILDADHAPIDSVGIALDEALEIKEYIGAQWGQISCSTYSNDKWIVDDAEDPWVVQEAEITQFWPQVGAPDSLAVRDQTVHKLFCMGLPEDITALEKALVQRHPALTIFQSTLNYLEITHPAARKSYGVKAICKRLGVGEEDTVSFGDNYNDLDMLLATGLGVAMGNAPRGVRDLAGKVTLTNDEDGLRVALEELFG